MLSLYFMKNYFCSFLVFLFLYAFSSCHSEGDGYMYEANNADKEFIHAIYHVSKHQVSLGTLALQRSSNDSVKLSAQKMISTHMLWSKQIDSLADNYNILLSDTLLAAHVQMALHLGNFNGYRFDTAYVNMQLMEHAHAQGLVNKENGYGNAIPVRDFAAKKAAELIEHTVMLQLVKEHVF